MRYHFIPITAAVIEEITSACENVEKRESLCTARGNVNWCSHYEKQYGGSSKTKNSTTMGSSKPKSRYVYKGNKNRISKR